MRTPRQKTSNPYQHIKREGGKRSGLELEVAANLQLCGVGFKGEKEIDAIEYTELRPKKYHPDYQLANGIIIECKGWFKPKDRSKHLCIKFQHPELDIRFVFSNPNAKLSKTSKTTYAMWCEKNGFKYAKGAVPDAWVQETCGHLNYRTSADVNICNNCHMIGQPPFVEGKEQ